MKIRFLSKIYLFFLITLSFLLLIYHLFFQNSGYFILLESLGAFFFTWIFYKVIYKNLLEAFDFLLQPENFSQTQFFFEKNIFDILNIHKKSIRIHERFSKLIKQAFNQSEELEKILENMTEGVVVLNDEGNIELANAAFLSMFQLQKPIRDKNLIEVLRKEEIQSLYKKTLEDKQTQFLEINFYKDQLHYYQIQSSYFLSLSAHHQVLLVFHDISPMKKLETIRRQFVANVSHELKTPLSLIQGYAETLIEPNLSDEEKIKFAQIIYKNTIGLNEMVNDLLDLSKFESGNFPLQIEKINLKQWFENLKNTFAQVLENKKINWEIDAPDDLVIDTDLRLFQAIFGNLIQNAIKYSDSHTSICSSIQKKNSTIEIVVKDQGYGIEESQLPRIFERFYRIDSSRSRELGGSGLGLSIVKHAVSLLKAEIQVKSEVGKGTEFCILFKS